jgi:hypothetical protein
LINRSIGGHHLHPQFLQKGPPEGKEFIIHQGLGNTDAHKAVLSRPPLVEGFYPSTSPKKRFFWAVEQKRAFLRDIKKISSNRAKGKVSHGKEGLDNLH